MRAYVELAGWPSLSPEPLGRSARKDKEAASPQRRPLCIRKRPVSPSSKTPKRDNQTLIANCVQARANQRQPIEILELLQVGHCSNRNIGTDPKMNRRMYF